MKTRKIGIATIDIPIEADGTSPRLQAARIK
jgi:hypothetical protein